MLKMSNAKVLLLIFTIAMVLRLLAVINLPQEYRGLSPDAVEYHMFAVNMLSGKGYVNDSNDLPSSRRVPMYPLFLAGIYCLFGENLFMARFMQSIIGALLCVIIFFIAKKIYNEKIAFIAAITMAFYQPHIFYLYFGGPAFLLSETLFTFLLALFVLFLLKVFFGEGSLKNICLSGIFLGAAVLTRPEIVFFPLFLFVLFLLYRKRYPALLRIKNISIFLFGLILVILPWATRNYLVHKKFVPLSTLGGFVFWTGNNPKSNGSWGRGLEYLSGEETVSLRQSSEAQRDKIYFKAGMDYLVNNPGRIPGLFFKKILVFWNPFNEGGSYNIWYGIILIFGVIAALRTFLFKENSNIGVSLLVLLFVYYTVISLIFYGDPRYRYPIEIYLLILASAGLAGLFRAAKSKSLSILVITLIVEANYFIYLNSACILNWIRRL